MWRSKLGRFEESVTVSATPTVDVASSGPVTVLTRETLEVVPSSRAGIITLMNQSPSVRSQLDVGGSQSNQLPAMRVYRIATQATSWLVLDGVVTTDAGQTGGGGSYFDYASFEEARMQTIANDVETPNRGINLNLIVKSGGNDFHGDASWEQTSSAFASSNLDDELRAQGITSPNNLERRFYGGADIGGRIIRNKLWFYSGVRGRLNRENPLGVTQPDGTPGIVEQTQFMVTNKVSSQVTRSHRFVFFDYYQRLIKDDPVTVQQGYETKQNNYQPQHTTKGEWQGVKGNSLVASLQVSRWRVHVTQNIRGTGPEKRHWHSVHIWNECGRGECGGPLSAVGDQGLGQLVPPRFLHGQSRLQGRVRRRQDHVGARMGLSGRHGREGRLWPPVQQQRANRDSALQRAELPAYHGSLHVPVLCRQMVRRAQAHAESRVPLGA